VIGFSINLVLVCLCDAGKGPLNKMIVIMCGVVVALEK